MPKHTITVYKASTGKPSVYTSVKPQIESSEGSKGTVLICPVPKEELDALMKKEREQREFEV